MGKEKLNITQAQRDNEVCITLTVRITPKMNQQLRAISEKEKRSQAYTVRELLEKALA
jgi:predicted DNA-binding protein